MATQRACPIRITLIKLVYLQPPTCTPLYTDNPNAKGIFTSAMRQKLSKAFNMRFYWVKDRNQQNQFNPLVPLVLGELLMHSISSLSRSFLYFASHFL